MWIETWGDVDLVIHISIRLGTSLKKANNSIKNKWTCVRRLMPVGKA